MKVSNRTMPKSGRKQWVQGNKNRNCSRGAPGSKQSGEISLSSYMLKTINKNNSVIQKFLLLLLNTDIQRNDHLNDGQLGTARIRHMRISSI